MVMNSEHEAVEEAISRLTPEVIRIIEIYRDSGWFGIADADVTRVGTRWVADAFARLLDLKLIRAYFEPAAPNVTRFVYTWTYTGKLAIKRMEAIFSPIPPSDVKANEVPTPDNAVRPGTNSVLTWLRGLWARRR